MQFCCGFCGYDLCGQTEPRCPECGRVVPEADWTRRSSPACIPWERRQHLSWFRAFCATFWWAWFHPRRLREGADRDSSVMTAIWFWLLLIPLSGLLVVGFAYLGWRISTFFPKWVPNSAYVEFHLWSTKVSSRIGYALHDWI